jgi:hypothetical protein
MTLGAAHPLRGSTHLHRVIMTGTKTRRAVAEGAVAHTTGAVIMPVVAPTTPLAAGTITHAVATRIGMPEAMIVIREEDGAEMPRIEDRLMRTAAAIGTTNRGQETTVRIPIPAGLSTRGRDMRTQTEPRTGKAGTTERGGQTSVSKTHTKGP